MKRVIFLLALCAVILSVYCGVSSACPIAPAGKTADGRTIFVGGFVPMVFVAVSLDAVNPAYVSAVYGDNENVVLSSMETMYGGILLPYVPKSGDKF